MRQTTDGVMTPDSTVFRAGMFSSLRNRDFKLLWVSNLAASFAMQMQMVARGWLIYDMTGSPLDLTWVMLAFMLPSLVFSLAGGVIADRMRKKSIMVTSQLFNTVATVLLATIIYQGDVTFAHFIYFGLFNGTVLSFSMPARSAVIPEIVGEESGVNAMALQSATFNLSRILGPVSAGGLMAYLAGGDTSSTLGVGIVFYLIALLYVVSVIATGLLRYTGKPSR
ncbi:MAG: MFS transporter, partial [Pseudomonadales bacterium]|nr:MFS transporter [Pseudomonadales bacterium]